MLARAPLHTLASGDYRSGVIFALCTLPGSVLGVLLANRVSRPLFDAIMGVVLGALAVCLLVSPQQAERGGSGPGTSRAIEDSEGNRYSYRARVGRGALLSVGVGLLSSFLGIGGGVLHVPLLVTVVGFPTHVATATSHFVLACMALVASLTHVFTGTFHHGIGLRRAAALSVGVIAGAQLGAMLSQRVSSRLIQRLLAAALLALGARLVLFVVL
jgi:uncharacterized protein